MTKEEARAKLDEFRVLIDAVDRRIVDLLNERTRVVEEIGRVKRHGSRSYHLKWAVSFFFRYCCRWPKFIVRPFHRSFCPRPEAGEGSPPGQKSNNNKSRRSHSPRVPR